MKSGNPAVAAFRGKDSFQVASIDPSDVGRAPAASTPVEGQRIGKGPTGSGNTGSSTVDNGGRDTNPVG